MRLPSSSAWWRRTVFAESLVPVLAYHVTEGVRNSKSVTSAKQVTMLGGGTITARGGFVDAANSDANFVAWMRSP